MYGDRRGRRALAQRREDVRGSRDHRATPRDALDCLQDHAVRPRLLHRQRRALRLSDRRAYHRVQRRAGCGNVAAAMPRLRKELAAAGNAIVESNSIMGFLRPDLYLSVLDHATADFKDSARLFLDRADALLIRAGSEELVPQWRGVSLKLADGIPRFAIAPPEYMSDAVIEFVQSRLSQTMNMRRNEARHIQAT